ncbi:MAG: hypothetical protein N2Z22_04215 [Turneriella sp.]|nr:hypothetical protein [Leptospiraceae bacterium]MCX7632520.1 hypothetical protein [Turneriella sp.]
MIVPMHQAVFFVHARQKKLFLRHLQNLGLVAPEWQPASRTVPWARKQQELQGLWQKIQKFRKSDAPIKEVKIMHSASFLLDFLQAEWNAYQELCQAHAELLEERKEIALWQNSDPEKYYSLAAHGLHIYLYSGSYRFFRRYIFPEIPMLVLSRKKDEVYFAVFSQDRDPPRLPFVLHPFPTRSLKDVDEEIALIGKRLREKEGLFKYLCRQKQLFARACAAAHHLAQKDWVQQKLEPVLHGQVFLLKAFFPEACSGKIKTFCEHHQIAYAFLPADGDAPVLLQNPYPISLFEKITRLFSLPHYQELDPTPFFAPFFMLFFGICLADAGHAIILALLSLVLLRYHSTRKLAELGLVLGAAALAAGILLNTFFGEKLFSSDGEHGILAAGSGLAVFAAYTAQGKTVYPALVLSLLLGALQLSVALMLQAFNQTWRRGGRYAIKPVGAFLLFLGSFAWATHHDILSLGLNQNLRAGPLPVGQWLSLLSPTLAAACVAVGLWAIIFWGAPDQKQLRRPLAGLWQLYQLVTGFLGDFLSYLRLFALALCSGLLGNAFNQIAFMLQDGGGWLATAGGIMVLVFGHTLNFALSLLAAIVHPLRLTFVEFYKNLGFRGGGQSFVPFRKLDPYDLGLLD